MKRFISLYAAALAVIFLISAVPASGQEQLTLGTVTIDPGHGGHDPGCISADGKTREKDITLDIALRLKRLMTEKHPSVKIVMTRETDVFIPLEDRAKISNSAHSDLFISIHVNAARTNQAKGYSIHCLGQSRRGNDLFGGNLDLVKRENSVILLEEDHETKYEGFNPDDPESYIIFSLIQNAHLGHSLMFADDVAKSMAATGPIRHNRGISQDPFWVLWRTASPSALIEVGFMSNASDLEKIRDPQAREEIAISILNAFTTFKGRFEAGSATGAPATAEPSDSVTTPVAAVEKVIYGTQVLASARKIHPGDPFFQGYTPYEIKVGNLYRYLLGASPDIEKAKDMNKEIKLKFPDSYMIKFEDGKSTMLK